MHAFLIMARSNSQELKNLLSSLDYDDNEIFLHIDAKANDTHSQLEKCCAHAKLIVVKSIKVSWAAYSQIEAELILLRNAVQSSQNYEYIHLLSENDLPVKSNRELHEFFKHKKTEFVQFSNIDDKTSLNKIKYYYYFQEFVGKKHGIIWLLQKILILCEHIFHTNRLKNIPYKKIGKGPNWFSITENFAKFILQNQSNIKKYFSFGRSADEIFIQTLLLNSKFKSNISSSSLGNLRYVRWEQGNSPEYLTAEKDYKVITSETNLFFARKFSNKIDKEIINRILKRIS